MTIQRDVQLSLVDGMEKPVGPILPSVFKGSNADLMAAVAPLYLTGSVLDVTHGDGKWWDRFRPEEFQAHDKFKLDGVDFTALPEADESFDTVCFDPPYVISGGKSTGNLADVGFQDRYGIGNANLKMTNSADGNNALHNLIRGGLSEASRVSRQWVLVKCMEFAQGSHCGTDFHDMPWFVRSWAQEMGLVTHDVIVHHTGSGPGGHNIFKVKRARRHHSYLLVFKKRNKR